MSYRSSGYDNIEDIVLCQSYLDVTQDPITGRYQNAERFWSRVEERYNEAKPSNMEPRKANSLRSRMQVINAAVKKLKSCVRQVENTHPSGASEADILIRAKHLLIEDPKYKRGFKFDHVWDMVKDFASLKDQVTTANNEFRRQNVVDESSQSDNPTPETPHTTSPSISAFSIDLDDDSSGGSSSQRPIGVKKAKLKRKIHDDMSANFGLLEKKNEELKILLEKSYEQKQTQIEVQKEQMQMQRQMLEIKEKNRELKIMLLDPNNISDPVRRAYIVAEQARISQKNIEQQQHVPSNSTSDAFTSLFNNIGSPGPDLPPYF